MLHSLIFPPKIGNIILIKSVWFLLVIDYQMYGCKQNLKKEFSLWHFNDLLFKYIPTTAFVMLFTQFISHWLKNIN